MSSFRWIDISLFLMLLLHLTKVTRQYSNIAVRHGDEVTLPCENVIDGQRKCDGTTWLFSHSRHTAAVELIKLGQIGERAKAKSDRLSVTASCSLVIKKVTVEDVGRYDCRQFRSGRQQGPDSQVLLSVVTMTEQQNYDMNILFCFEWTRGRCTHKVEWLHRVHDVDKDNTDLKTSQCQCSATATFMTWHLDHKSNYYESFKCKVTDIQTGKVQLVTFSPESSGERTDCSALNYIMLVMRVAELLLITAITVLLIRARGNQRPPDDNTVLNSVRSRTVKRSGPAASQVNDDEDDGEL
ncbi:uncharacterized protein LOC122863073 isoform X3 [Siniperca chuatsi]|uniref:uncharacterized protein LOC122863073 isoform X3 n=1 Tax=Siniperca chuatsi TaxID=119488 RepID=UPI001CE1647C|nr:uncharacterized protein LOC122863073 isoform X3 [Siniperca chuatsi]